MNNLQSRLFTPNFSREDKTLLWKALGLTQLDFHFCEMTSEQVLRSLQIVAGVAHEQLEPRTPSDFVPSPRAILVKRKRTHSLPVLRPTTVDLWYELMPFPLNRLSYFFQGNPDEATIHFSCGELETDLRSLWSTFRALEDRLLNSELGLIWIKNADQRFALLVHHVRRRRIRMGTSDLLCDMGRKWDEGTLDGEGLRQAFGTRVDWLTLEVPSSGLLSELVGSIQNALQAAPPLGFQAGNPAPQPEIHT